MIRRSWFRLAMGNAGLAAIFALVAVLTNDPRIAWAMIANSIGSVGVAAWALRKDDGNAQ